jgi:hypothetical protein
MLSTAANYLLLPAARHLFKVFGFPKTHKGRKLMFRVVVEARETLAECGQAPKVSKKPHWPSRVVIAFEAANAATCLDQTSRDTLSVDFRLPF